MNPRDYSLRELSWMSEGRMEKSGELAAWHVANIIARMPFTATVVDPREINPYRDEDSASPQESEAMAKLKAWQAKRIWRAIHTPKK